MAHGFDLDAMIADRSVQIVLCTGSGGVGKTTTSAAVALRAAEAGRRVVVLTIDPAKRLAQSLGVEELDNTPRAVQGLHTNGEGALESHREGSLDAMMLDMKRTFDDVVTGHATPERAAQILENPFYQALSTSFAGTQEYMAMEKLGQLHAEAARSGRWDLIVVDTPPSRSALDFLDAPEHLSNLLDGRMLRMFLAPAKGPMKLMGAGIQMVTSTMQKVLGAQVLTDVQTFVTAFETLFGGFKERAEKTLATLSSAHTRFLVVAGPNRDALREAGFFVDRLGAEAMPLAAVVINRVHAAVAGLDEARTQALRADAPDRLAELALEQQVRRLRVVAAEQQAIARFRTLHPGVPLVSAAAQPRDVSDLAALREIGALLAAPGSAAGQ